VKTNRFRIRPGKRVTLADYDPADSAPYKDRAEAEGLLEPDLDRLRSLQEKLYAEDRWSLLLIFQAMDAAGKDSVVEHVLRGLNPQGTQTVSFKAPTSQELDHDYLWRCLRVLPQRGRIGIFIRSYYEEVLVVRVNPGILAAQRLPPSLVTKRIWRERYEDINAMERYLTRNGVAVCKFFLHVSRDEQRKRFLERIDNPAKNWKFELGDLKTREQWDAYQTAFEKMLSATSTEWAPWHVIPADRKWFTRLAVARIVRETLEGLNPQFPQLSTEQLGELAQSRKTLMAEEDAKRKKRTKRRDGDVDAITVVSATASGADSGDANGNVRARKGGKPRRGKRRGADVSGAK
jgi:PPK2 family polyphosphate:nucleotide phosphotransferase